MVYKLKQGYILRGWDKMEWVLVHRPENRYKRLTSVEFQVLLLCDGTVDFDTDYITDEMKMVVNRLLKEGSVEIAETGSELDKDQYYCYYDNRFVRSVLWSITGRCNYHCRHCFMDAPGVSLGELSHEQALNLIDQMAECGVLRVNITGGEPFVRKDFWTLIDRIQSYKMTIGQVYTNGWLIDDVVLDEFEKRGLRPEFSISFDGVGWHDWMRGVPGAEKAALMALRLCKKRKFPMNVEMCVHKGNYNTLAQTVKLLSEIGVPALKVSNVSASGLWKNNSEGNEMNVREYVETMIRYIPEFYQAGMPMNVMLAGIVTLYKDSRKFFVIPKPYDGTKECEEYLLCGATRYACYISPEGRILPCMPMTACKEQKNFPLLQDISLKKALSNSFYMDIVDSRVKDLLKSNSKCNACEHKYYCGGGCRAIALEQTGDLMGCDERQCILWNEGYVDRIYKAAETAAKRT